MQLHWIYETILTFVFLSWTHWIKPSSILSLALTLATVNTKTKHNSDLQNLWLPILMLMQLVQWYSMDIALLYKQWFSALCTVIPLVCKVVPSTLFQILHTRWILLSPASYVDYIRCTAKTLGLLQPPFRLSELHQCDQGMLLNCRTP